MIWDDNDTTKEDISSSPPPKMPAFIQAVLLFLMLWQMSFGVSDIGLGVLILFMHQLNKFI